MLAQRELDRRRADECVEDLHEFVREFWSIVEPGTPFVDGWAIQAISSHYQAISEGRLQYLIVNIPPRHAKSLITNVFWPVWSWVRRPEGRWVFASYSAGLTIRDSLKRLRLLRSPKFRAWYGDRFTLDRSQRAKSRFDNDRGGQMFTTSVGAQLTGEGYGSGGALVCDDLLNAIDAESEAKLAELEVFWAAASTRANNPATDPIAIIGQRLHERDIVGLALKDGNDYDRLVLPARFDPEHPVGCRSTIGFVDPRTTPGELLWPERFPEEHVAKLERRLGPRGAAAQLQQLPQAAGGGVFKREWFGTRWEPAYGAHAKDYVRIDGKNVDIQRGYRFATVDPAWTESKEAKSAYSAICVWSAVGSTQQPRLVLREVWRDRVQVPDLINKMTELRKKYGLQGMYVEKDGAGVAAMPYMRAAGLPIRELSARQLGSKETRAFGAGPICADGRVILPKNAPWLQTFEGELYGFPVAATRDQTDAFVYGCLIASGTAGIGGLTFGMSQGD